MKSAYSLHEKLIQVYKSYYSSAQQRNDLDSQFELFKKSLIHAYSKGMYFYIFNFNILNFDSVSASVKDVLGYSESEFELSFILSKIHPDDHPFFLNFEAEAGRFLSNLPKEKVPNYKMRMDYRIQKKDGSYIRILQEGITIQQHENGSIFRTIGIHTDITDIKPFGKPLLSFIGLNGEPSFIDVKVGRELIKFKDVISAREKEVLSLIILGKISKEISDILHISKQTVDNHRKNMLQKTNSNNLGELIANAIKNGWL